MTAEPLSTQRDLGFGSVVADQSRDRLLNPDGSFNVRRRSLPWRSSLSVFNSLITMTWPRFLGLVTVFYLLVNACFAILYLACGPQALTGPPVAGLMDRTQQAFFFSVHTFSTVGYGHITPTGTLPNLLMTLEAIVGLLSTALATGIVFARFSRPVARIYFTPQAVVGRYGDLRALKFRIANLRKSQIIELQAQVIFTRLEDTPQGQRRRFYELQLERRRVTFFPLHWTLVHPIDEASPLRGVCGADCLTADAEVLILLTGIDETFSQTVHARSSYKAYEIVWNADFANVFHQLTETDRLSIDMHRLSEIVQLDESSLAGASDQTTRM